MPDIFGSICFYEKFERASAILCAAYIISTPELPQEDVGIIDVKGREFGANCSWNIFLRNISSGKNLPP